MNLLVTICARAGSKGVASKNVRDFLGHPICYYTLAALQLFQAQYGAQYAAIDLAVNTDAPALFEQIDATGIPYLKIPRRDDLAGDTASKIDVIRDTLAQAVARTGRSYDIVLDMDLTSPLRRGNDIQNVIEALQENPMAEVALSVTEARRNPWFNQLVKQSDGFYKTAIASGFVARQQAPPVYDANASLYAYRPAFLAGTTTILIQAKLAVSVMPDTAVLDIDSEQDYALLQLLAPFFYQNDPDYGAVFDRVKHLDVKGETWNA